MFRSVALTLVLCLATISAQASLLGRAPLTPGGTDYQAYYDTGLNITWLADANLAQTNSFGLAVTDLISVSGAVGSNGLMTWYIAQDWISAMNLFNGGSGYLGVNNWRLPTAPQPDATCQFQFNRGSPYPLQGTGLGCTGSEMGYLSNVEGVSYSTPGPFMNVRHDYYFTGTLFPPGDAQPFVFYFAPAGQQYVSFVDQRLFAWAVSPGDFAVPIPPAIWLFGSALGLMGVARRKQAPGLNKYQGREGPMWDVALRVNHETEGK